MSNPERKTKIVSVRYKPGDLERIDAQARTVNLSRSEYIEYLTNVSHLPSSNNDSDFWEIYQLLGELSKSLKENILPLKTQSESIQLKNLSQILSIIDSLRLNLCKQTLIQKL